MTDKMIKLSETSFETLDLADLLWSSIEVEGLKNYLESIELQLQKDLIRMILPFAFDEEIANVLVPVMTQPQAFYPVGGYEDDKDDKDVPLQGVKKATKRTRGSATTSLKTPLLSFTWESDANNNNPQTERRILMVDMNGVDDTKTDSQQKK